MLTPSHKSFAIGRRWWVVPVAVMVAQMLLYVTLELTTGFDGRNAADWWLFISQFVMLPALAAILVSPGARWPQWLLAFVCVCWGVFVFGLGEGFHIEMVIPALVVWAIQAAVLRWTATPPWRIRPSRSRRTPVSIRWLLAFTAVVAGLITLVRVSDAKSELIAMTIYIVPAVIASLFANYLVMMESRQVRRVILLGVFFAGAFLHSAAEQDWVPAEAIVESLVGPGRSDRFASKILFVAPSSSLVLVTLMQRLMMQFGAGRERGRSAVSRGDAQGVCR